MIQKKTINGGQQAEVVFMLPAELAIGRLAVVGEFNDWDPMATPMRRRKDVVTAAAILETGRRYQFRYLREDGEWINDEAADAFEPNNFGTTNCVLALEGPT